MDFVYRPAAIPEKNIAYHLKLLALNSNKDIRKEIDYDRYAPSGMDLIGGKEIVIPPTAFNFPGAEDMTTFSFKRDLAQVYRTERLSSRYLACVNKIIDLRAQGKKIVYVSLGTLSLNDKKRAVHFYKVLKKVCGKMDKTTYFIISIGKNVFPVDFVPYSRNIFLFKQVPQLHLLSYCDLMITHGGMNSITECILKEIPMLVYPLNKSWDQPGNAARVVFHGLGLKGNMCWITPDSIQRRIDGIWDHYDSYKDNIRKMKARIASEPDTAMDYINSLLV